MYNINTLLDKLNQSIVSIQDLRHFIENYIDINTSNLDFNVNADFQEFVKQFPEFNQSIIEGNIIKLIQVYESEPNTEHYVQLLNILLTRTREHGSEIEWVEWENSDNNNNEHIIEENINKEIVDHEDDDHDEEFAEEIELNEEELGFLDQLASDSSNTPLVVKKFSKLLQDKDEKENHQAIINLWHANPELHGYLTWPSIGNNTLVINFADSDIRKFIYICLKRQFNDMCKPLLLNNMDRYLAVNDKEKAIAIKRLFTYHRKGYSSILNEIPTETMDWFLNYCPVNQNADQQKLTNLRYILRGTSKNVIAKKYIPSIKKIVDYFIKNKTNPALAHLAYKLIRSLLDHRMILSIIELKKTDIQFFINYRPPGMDVNQSRFKPIRSILSSQKTTLIEILNSDDIHFFINYPRPGMDPNQSKFIAIKSILRTSSSNTKAKLNDNDLQFFINFSRANHNDNQARYDAIENMIMYRRNKKIMSSLTVDDIQFFINYTPVNANQESVYIFQLKTIEFILTHSNQKLLEFLSDDHIQFFLENFYQIYTDNNNPTPAEKEIAKHEAMKKLLLTKNVPFIEKLGGHNLEWFLRYTRPDIGPIQSKFEAIKLFLRIEREICVTHLTQNDIFWFINHYSSDSAFDASRTAAIEYLINTNYLSSYILQCLYNIKMDTNKNALQWYFGSQQNIKEMKKRLKCLINVTNICIFNKAFLFSYAINYDRKHSLIKLLADYQEFKAQVRAMCKFYKKHGDDLSKLKLNNSNLPIPPRFLAHPAALYNNSNSNGFGCLSKMDDNFYNTNKNQLNKIGITKIKKHIYYNSRYLEWFEQNCSLETDNNNNNKKRRTTDTMQPDNNKIQKSQSGDSLPVARRNEQEEQLNLLPDTAPDAMEEELRNAEWLTEEELAFLESLSDVAISPLAEVDDFTNGLSIFTEEIIIRLWGKNEALRQYFTWENSSDNGNTDAPFNDANIRQFITICIRNKMISNLDNLFLNDKYFQGNDTERYEALHLVLSSKLEFYISKVTAAHLEWFIHYCPENKNANKAKTEAIKILIHTLGYRLYMLYDIKMHDTQNALQWYLTSATSDAGGLKDRLNALRKSKLTEDDIAFLLAFAVDYDVDHNLLDILLIKEKQSSELKDKIIAICQFYQANKDDLDTLEIKDRKPQYDDYLLQPKVMYGQSRATRFISLDNDNHLKAQHHLQNLGIISHRKKMGNVHCFAFNPITYLRNYQKQIISPPAEALLAEFWELISKDKDEQTISAAKNYIDKINDTMNNAAAIFKLVKSFTHQDLDQRIDCAMENLKLLEKMRQPSDKKTSLSGLMNVLNKFKDNHFAPLSIMTISWLLTPFAKHIAVDFKPKPSLPAPLSTVTPVQPNPSASILPPNIIPATKKVVTPAPLPSATPRPLVVAPPTIIRPEYAPIPAKVNYNLSHNMGIWSKSMYKQDKQKASWQIALDNLWPLLIQGFGTKSSSSFRRTNMDNKEVGNAIRNSLCFSEHVITNASQQDYKIVIKNLQTIIEEYAATNPQHFLGQIKELLTKVISIRTQSTPNNNNNTQPFAQFHP